MSRTDADLRQGGHALNVATSGGAASPKSRRKVTWLYIPALAFMIVMTQIPFVLAVWFSLHSWNLLEPALGFPFVGLANYINEFVADPSFWPVIGHTAELVFGA